MSYNLKKTTFVVGFLGVSCAAFASENASVSNDLVDIPALTNTSVILNRHVPLRAISPNTLKTFVDVIDLIRNRYVDEVNDEKLFADAMAGMLKSLDKNAEFLDKTTFENLQTFTEGMVADVGVQAGFSDKENHWVVNAVVQGSSAEMAGIGVGDYIHQIDDKKLTDLLSASDVAQSLAGVAGTQVWVSFSKQGRTKQQIKLQRTTPKNQTLVVKFDGEIAQVVLPVFTQRTPQELINALSQIDKPIKGIVFDVRGNPGGVLSSAIEVASLFIGDTPVANVVERGRLVQVLATEQTDPPLAGIPVIMLQNRYSASAAEVLSVALKHYPYATIVGETSYGKGSIQSVIPIKDGQAIKLTTARYEKLDGGAIDGTGVAPDVTLTGEDWATDTMQLMQAKKLANGYLVNFSRE